MKGWLRHVRGGLFPPSPSRKRRSDAKVRSGKKSRTVARSPRFEVQGEYESNSAGLLSEESGDEPEAPALEEISSVTFNGDSAMLNLHVGQVACMDGCATVTCVKGGATMLGYNLLHGVEVYVCSSSKISPVVCFEPCLLHTKAKGSRSSSRKDDAGCILEFKSHHGGLSTDDGTQRLSFKIVVCEAGVGGKGDSVAEPMDGSGAEIKVKQARKHGETDSDGCDSEAEASDESMDEEKQMDIDKPLVLRKRMRADDQDMPVKRRKEMQDDMRSIVLPPSWCAAADAILQYNKPGGPIVAVCGAKNTGKSTFGRYLVNRLLNSYDAVAYLDSDVGQPEFTVPGCLSLHIIDKPITGPPAFHLHNPERCFFFGDISPKSNPTLYMQQFESLYHSFQNLIRCADGELTGDRQTPLVINTHGWVKGVGYNLLVHLLGHTNPTHTVQVLSQVDSKNLPRSRFWDVQNEVVVDTELLYISTPSPDRGDAVDGNGHAGRSAVHMRGLRVLSYFQQCFGRDLAPLPFREERLFTQTATDLTFQVPYVVSSSAVKVVHLHSEVPRGESLYSINGELVGLAIGGCPKDGEDPLQNSHPLCVGFGIVRAVDLSVGLIYLITPMPLEQLEDVDTVLQGRVKLPLPLLLAKGYESPYLCLNSADAYGTGAAAMKTNSSTPRRVA